MFSPFKKLLALSIIGFTIGGCASINSVSLTPIPSNRFQEVRAEVSKFIILGFNFDNDFINPLVENLKSQCPQGVVSGILTKDETISYFLAHTKRVVATGYCNLKEKVASTEEDISKKTNNKRKRN